AGPPADGGGGGGCVGGEPQSGIPGPSQDDGRDGDRRGPCWRRHLFARADDGVCGGRRSAARGRRECTGKGTDVVRDDEREPGTGNRELIAAPREQPQPGSRRISWPASLP